MSFLVFLAAKWLVFWLGVSEWAIFFLSFASFSVRGLFPAMKRVYSSMTRRPSVALFRLASRIGEVFIVRVL